MPGSALRTTARVKEDDLFRYPSLGLCVQIGATCYSNRTRRPRLKPRWNTISCSLRNGLAPSPRTPGLYSHNNFFFSILFSSAFVDIPQSTLLPLRAVSCCPQPWMTIMMGLAQHGLLLQGNYFASR